MSCIVGMLLHNALLDAGHHKWNTVRTDTDWLSDTIKVRFDSGPDGTSLFFTVPNHLFDPVEYAQEKWPEWFVKPDPAGTQLDLFNQERS
jgi:hypothetical protein